MRLTATKPLRYGGRDLVPGDDFDARHPRDARLLKAIGKAKDFEKPAKVAKAPAPDDNPDASDDEADKPVAKGADSTTYKRRDMRAEQP